MHVPFLSLEKIHSELRTELTAAFTSTLDSNHFILGPSLERFENEFASYCGTRFCLGVSNGLDALIISLKALELKEGDEIIVPSNTFIATVLAVSAIGATPVFVEPDADSYNITSEGIKQKINSSTKAVIAVNLYGQPCRLDQIRELCDNEKIYLIEDNAQSQGASVGNKRTGSFGHINATSFYPGKNIGALGDGGAITTDDKNLYERCQALRNYGSSRKYIHPVKGMNARLDEMQAAFLSVKLKRLDSWNAERRRLAGLYKELLADANEIILPKETHEDHVYHLFVIRTKKRTELMEHLSHRKIGTLIHYPVPPHLQAAYKDLGLKKGDLPLAEQLAEECLSLPLYPGLSDDQVRFVSSAIKEFYA